MGCFYKSLMKVQKKKTNPKTLKHKPSITKYQISEAEELLTTSTKQNPDSDSIFSAVTGWFMVWHKEKSSTSLLIYCTDCILSQNALGPTLDYGHYCIWTEEKKTTKDFDI